MHLEDTRILIGLKKEDHKAYKELFDLYYIPLCLYSLKFTDSYLDAEDIVQELFVDFWNKKIFKRVDSNLKSYLFRAVRNNSLRFLKKNNKIIYDSLEDLEIEFPEVESEELSIRTEKLKKEINALPHKSREVFIEIVLNDLKYKEAAEKLGVSVNTIKTNFSRALKKLRSSLDIIILIMLP